MAADASIYGQIQQPKPVNMLAEYADMARIQSAQQQNALNQFAMGEKVRGIERQNKLMEIAPQGANALRSAGFWKEALEMEEGQTKREKATIDAENARLGVRKTKDELIGSRAAFLRTNPTPENAAAFFDGLAQDNLMPADMAGQFKSLSVSNPDKIGAFADQLWRAAISAEKQMPKTQSTSAGGFTANLAIDPLTGVATETGRIQHTVSPDAQLSAETSRRGQNMTDARAREANNNAKAPAGYRYKPDGSLEAIPGGPADIKAGEAGEKAKQRAESGIQGAQSVIKEIQDAKSLVGMNTAGAGGLLANIPATEARNLSAKLETIKANLGFDRLQQMRDMSPTGGALGAVAVQELTALQSTVASLDQMQSPKQLSAALDKVEGHYQNWVRVMKQAKGGGQGGATGEWGGASPPAAGGVPDDIAAILKKHGGK